MKLFYWIRSLALGAVCSSLPLTAGATTIFDNSANDLATRFAPGTLEVGDEILLTGNERYLTNFSFEYWGTNTIGAGNPLFSGIVQARVRFYKNDGPPFNGYATPGTCFWVGSWFSVFPTARNVLVFQPGVDFPASGVYLPASDMTWSVQFQGMAPTDVVGIDFYSPAVIGADFPDYWQRSGEGGTWELLTNSVPTDFGATMQATLIPDPAIPFIALIKETNQGIVTWPGWATNYVLETSSSLSSWTTISSGISWNDNNFVLTNPISADKGFFRLQKQ